VSQYTSGGSPADDNGVEQHYSSLGRRTLLTTGFFWIALWIFLGVGDGRVKQIIFSKEFRSECRIAIASEIFRA